MDSKKALKIAIVQRSAVFNNLSESIALAIEIVEDASSTGANLVVFGECWLCGYPAWIDHARDYSRWNDAKTKAEFVRMHQNSVSLKSQEFEQLRDASAKFNICIVIGMNEIDTPSSGTIYNTVVILDQGKLVLHHRKLMPTYTERLLYGTGDGRGTHAVNTSCGRIGGLICWEHWMPMVRQRMHDSVETIHVALWPQVHEMLQIASRHYAFEGRCFVIAVGQVVMDSQMPELLDSNIKNEQMLLNGGSAVIGPDGHYRLKPQYDNADVIYFEIDDLDQTVAERMTLDVAGHYHRPDLFEYRFKPEADEPEP